MKALSIITGALLGAAAFFAFQPNQANAGMTCSKDLFDKTVCKMDSRTTHAGDIDVSGNDRWKGSDGSSSFCKMDSFGNYVCN